MKSGPSTSPATAKGRRSWICSPDAVRTANHAKYAKGNFADVGRQIVAALFAELPTVGRREVTSAVAHYIAGVLPWEPMVEIVEGLCESADLNPRDRVKTLLGTSRGVIVRKLDDGRLAWKVDGSGAELISLPEGLIPDPTQPSQ